MAVLLLALAQTAVPPTPVPPPVPHAIDWQALPPLPYRRTPQLTARMTMYVAAESARTACPRPVAVAGRVQMPVDIAVLIGAKGMVRATIPRAIGCPTVEQYAAGLVISFTRSNLIPRLVSEGGWYRASLVFEWQA
jgi:hypothetical protein